jgi:hypothetical protein
MKHGARNKLDEKEMIEGYLALAQENKLFADMAAEIAYEVIPEWK